MFLVPGKSHQGPLPPLTPFEKELSTRLSTHVWMLASDIGARSLTSAPQNLENAALYIEQILGSFGYSVLTQEFEVDVDVFAPADHVVTGGGISFVTVTHKTRNIIVEIAGARKKDEIVVVGAHYDSDYGCPAANDNASGVAAVIELARMFSKARCDRTIRFVAFTNEEQPFFGTDSWGSGRYARSCHERGEKIVAMMSLETIGYYTDEPDTQKLPHDSFKLFLPTTGNFLAFITNLSCRPLLTHCVETFRKEAQFPSQGMALPELITGVGSSDHAAFWKYGYPALMVTDTAFYRYPHYHQATDTPDKIDFDMLARVVRGLGAVSAQLSGATL